MKTVFFVALLQAATAGEAGPWDYKTGGVEWTGTCPTGKEQSPIDLTVNTDAPKNFSVKWNAVPARLEAVHSVLHQSKADHEAHPHADFMVTKADGGWGGTPHASSPLAEPARLVLEDGTEGETLTFQPFQFHIHAPSEHTVAGKYMDLEMHTVSLPVDTYAAKAKTDNVAAAAFGVFFNALDCATATKDLMGKDMTKEECEKKVAATDKLFEALKIPELIAAIGDAAAAATAKHELATTFAYREFLDTLDLSSFWRYNGSVTTPPCAESVKWTVIKEVQPIKPATLKIVKEFYAPYQKDLGNNRAIQPLNTRTLNYVGDFATTLASAGIVGLASILLF